MVLSDFRTIFYLFHAELVDAAVSVGLAWTESCCRPLRTVRRIREELCLDADRSSHRILDAVLAGYLACKEVTCVDLYSRLVSVLLEEDACSWRVNAESELGDVTCCVEHPVVVVTVSKNELIIVLIDVLTDSLWSTEIERSTLYWTHFAGRDEVLVCRSECISIHIKDHVCSLYCVIS